LGILNEKGGMGEVDVAWRELLDWILLKKIVE
jgi:hypothetical protein